MKLLKKYPKPFQKIAKVTTPGILGAIHKFIIQNNGIKYVTKNSWKILEIYISLFFRLVGGWCQLVGGPKWQIFSLIRPASGGELFPSRRNRVDIEVYTPEKLTWNLKMMASQKESPLPGGPPFSGSMLVFFGGGKRNSSSAKSWASGSQVIADAWKSSQQTQPPPRKPAF